MHEFSIAASLADLAEAHAPPGTRVQSVKMRAGPMRGIDAEAMQLAWQAVCGGRERCAGAGLEIELTPWVLRCSDCGA
jgi:Zn finger protein HypA/HybF involved in hydrogenase expression